MLSNDTEDFQMEVKINSKTNNVAAKRNSSKDIESENTLIKIAEKWKGAKFVQILMYQNEFVSETNDQLLGNYTTKKGTVAIEFISPNSTLQSSMNSSECPSNDTSIDLEINDIQLVGSLKILIITELDYIGGGNMYKRKLARFYKAKGEADSAAVICVKTNRSAQDFANVQTFCVIELGLPLIPISDNMDALIPQVISQLINVNAPNRRQKNPFKFGIPQRNNGKANGGLGNTTRGQILKTLSTISGIGENKATSLIEKFGSISNVALASKEELSGVVGESVACKILNFFGS